MKTSANSEKPPRKVASEPTEIKLNGFHFQLKKSFQAVKGPASTDEYIEAFEKLAAAELSKLRQIARSCEDELRGLLQQRRKVVGMIK